MPVQLVDEISHEPKLIELSVVIATIEKNRDRIRTLGSMIISTAGLLFSANLAFILLVVEKFASISLFLIALFFLALLFLLSTLVISISASFLRQNYSIVSELKYLDNLLHIYHRELRIIRISFILLIISLLLLLSVITIFVYNILY